MRTEKRWIGGVGRGTRLLTLLLLSSVGIRNTVLAQGPPPLPEPPAYRLLNFWTFNTTNWAALRGNLPKDFYGLESVTSSWASNAVRIAGANALLQYNEIETTGGTNLVCDSGCLRFWFRPTWDSANTNGGTGPGSFGRLLEVGAYTPDASGGWWALFLDSGGTNLYFSAQSNGLSGTFVSAPIQWTSNTWHLITLNYSPTGSVLWLDAQQAATGSGVLYWPDANVRTDGFTLGSDSQGQNLAQGDFENLQTSTGYFSDWYVTNYYWTIASQYPLGPDQGEGSSSPVGYEPTGNGLLGAGEGVKLLIELRQGTNVWLTITNGEAGALYDLFGTPTLDGSTLVGSTNWSWLVQGMTNGEERLLTTAGLPYAFYMLGTSVDADGDGVTDAVENLVLKTDAANPDSDGDGLADGYEFWAGLEPRAANSAPTLSSRAINKCPVP